MRQFLFSLFGTRVGKEVVSAELHWRNAGAFGWLILAAASLLGFTWWTYRHSAELLSASQRRALITLRVAFLWLLLAILLRPVLTLTMEANTRRMFAGLFDASASMAIRDIRAGTDLKRSALYAAPADAANIARVDLARVVLKAPALHLLASLRREFDLAGFGFDKSAARFDPASAGLNPEHLWPDSLSASGLQTAIGDSLLDVLGQKRAEPLAGVFLVTDGGNNFGSDPMEAARAAAAQDVPLYIYGVGITSPRDVIVSNMVVPDLAFVGDELQVNVHVKGLGYPGQKSTLALKCGDSVVAEKEIEFTSGDQLITLGFTPKSVGEFTLQASIPPRDDEASRDNNFASERLRVTDSKIKVLFVEQAPRWEFRFLSNVLLRDRRLNLKSVLLEGDPEIAHVENSPYLDAIPSTKEALLGYDLIIIGDVDPKAFSQAQMDTLAEFVSRFGGSVMFIAGKRYDPSSYAATPFEKLFPVTLDGATPFGGKSRSLPVVLTSLGRTNAMLRLSSSEEDSALRWGELPPLEWIAPAGRVKPAAETLLECVDPTLSLRQGVTPVLVIQQYGLGQVLYVGTDDTWRWRKNAGESLYTRFWGQVAQRMALAHLLGGAKRTQLSVDKQNYLVGEHVTVYARLFDEHFKPIEKPSVDGSFTIASAVEHAGHALRVQLRPVPEQPGMFRGDLDAETPGSYRLSIKDDPATSVGFSVTPPRVELDDTTMNEPLLRSMAQASGGAFFREEDLPKLLGSIHSKAGGVRFSEDTELWSTPFYFIVLLLTVSSEWILRKRWHLK